VGNLSQHFRVPDGHGWASQSVEQAGIRGQQHQVGPDAVGAPVLVVQHARENAHNRQNHNDFNGHGQHADDGAQGAMQQIGKNQFVHLRAGFRARKSAEKSAFRVTDSG
jgi:hypothetical protein